jgi:hypothetical protein
MTTTKQFVTEQEECWILGGEILDQGMDHPALRAIQASLNELCAGLAEAQIQSAGLKRHGVGRTEDPALLLARVVPRLRSLSETAAIVADQMTARLRRG